MTTRRLAAAVFVLLAPAVAVAELADRDKPTQWEASHLHHDDIRQVMVLEGGVVITRGTFVLRAERVEIRQDPEGYQFGTATGTRDTPARFRQKREGVDQYIEGDAQRIDYDGKADRVTLTGFAHLCRLEGATPADEVNGHVIVYDNRVEQYTVSGGSASATQDNPQGRIRGTIAPGTPAPAAPAAPAAPLRRADSLGPAPAKK